MPYSQKDNSGFSLIEIILACAFIAIIVSILFTAVGIWRSIRNLQWETLAYNIAKHKMEDLRNTSFESLPATGNFTDPQILRLPGGFGQITTFGSDPKGITVKVSWNQQGTIKNYTLETLFTEK